MDLYQLQIIYCDNCNESFNEKIKKGMTVENYCKDKICSGCGCKTMTFENY